jgi:lipopolysaccharide export system permease protein
VILFRYVARRALVAMLGALAGVVALYLAVDFVDNSASWGREPGWQYAALELYANKAVVVARMVAPAAILLGASLAISGFRATREWTAMRALGLGPWRLGVPVLAVAFGAGVVMVGIHDFVGVAAAHRADELAALRFGRGGDTRRYMAAREPKRWFRGADGRRIYYLRGQLPEGAGFKGVTVLEVDPSFHLVRRIDAERMRPDGAEWILDAVEDRVFDADGTMRLTRAAERRYRFDEPPDSFNIIAGRPAELRWATLIRQIDLRRRLGLSAVELQLERENRIAYPFAAVPGVLLALALALRRNRKGHVAAALGEAVAVSLLFWGAQGVSWALGMSGQVSPLVAAWAPNVLVLALGLVAVRRVA